MDHLQKQADMKLQNLTYLGERNNWNLERFVSAHKDQHTILEVLTDHGYNGLDSRTKVTCLMDDVKVDSLKTIKATIIENIDFQEL